MPDDAFKALRAQLGGELPRGISGLDAAEVEHLANAVTEARRRQAQALAAAGEAAFAHIPRLLRGPIRRLLG